MPDAGTNGALHGLEGVNQAFAARHPGDRPQRQPVHTVYGGGHLFTADTAPRMGAIARAALDEYAPTPAVLAKVVQLGADPRAVYARIREKLRREPVEDFRIDFEDGYGSRPDAEEDGHAQAAAREVAAGLRAGTLPAFIGIRVKPLTEELNRRTNARAG